MKLTPKQEAALLAAYSNNGRIFQVPENRKHNPAVLAALAKKGLLAAAPVGTVWTLTEAGREALTTVYREEKSTDGTTRWVRVDPDGNRD